MKGEKEKNDEEKEDTDISSSNNITLFRSKKESGLSALKIVFIILVPVIVLGLIGILIYCLKFKKIGNDDNPGSNETQLNINTVQNNSAVLNK